MTKIANFEEIKGFVHIVKINILKASSTEGEKKNTRLQVRTISLEKSVLCLAILLKIICTRYETIPASEEEEEVAPKAANYK